MDQHPNNKAQSVNMQQNIGNKNQPVKKDGYEKPKSTRLGHLAQVTQKSGLVSDGADPNPTRMS